MHKSELIFMPSRCVSKIVAAGSLQITGYTHRKENVPSAYNESTVETDYPSSSKYCC